MNLKGQKLQPETIQSLSPFHMTLSCCITASGPVVPPSYFTVGVIAVYKIHLRREWSSQDLKPTVMLFTPLDVSGTRNDPEFPLNAGRSC